ARTDDSLYEGADMGILIMRGRLMTDDYQLTERAEKWTKAIRGKYVTQLIKDNRDIPQHSGMLAK
ncbi:MAG: biotin carboxylase, partial [Flavobacteriales bacterium]|nr:biotin carboxylase [Flavobacteriales bacterium]